MSFMLVCSFLSFYMKSFHNGHTFGIVISCKLMIQKQSSLTPENTESPMTQTLNVGSAMGCGFWTPQEKICLLFWAGLLVEGYQTQFLAVTYSSHWFCKGVRIIYRNNSHQESYSLYFSQYHA